MTRSRVTPELRTGIYPGTFDPITNGHTDVIRRALRVVDRLVIAVAEDSAKTPLFSLRRRTHMVEQEVSVLPEARRIEVTSFKGLLTSFVRQRGGSVLIRGLRAVSDFEYEFQLAAMNARLAPEVQTVFIPASEPTQFIASRLVKEVARLGGDVSSFVSPHVAGELQAHYVKK